MRRLARFRRAMLSSASHRAINAGLGPMHMLTLDTIMLRVGLALGVITTAGQGSAR